MKKIFLISNYKELLELMIQIGCREVHKFDLNINEDEELNLEKIKKLIYPREVILVGDGELINDDKFLYVKD